MITSNLPPLDPKEIFPFKLDKFQEKAMACLDEGKSVVVCAPTGSGKTVIGEYAIYRAISCGKRLFYTTPLKALSNQKFRDFQTHFENSHKVGLITGDILINPDAPIVVMTTEIFRNMLYETPIGQVGTSLEDVGIVVLDECHYISDRSRGTVWEESIIYCPKTIQILALSASVGNPEELTDWINRVRLQGKSNQAENSCELVNSDFRPVPLQFLFSTKEGLYPLLDNKNNKLNPKLKAKIPKGRRLRRDDCPSVSTIIEQLRARNLLPAIYVIFSRRGCEQALKEINTLDLVNENEAKELIYHLLNFFLEENIELQDKILTFLQENSSPLYPKLMDFLANPFEAREQLLDFLQENLSIKQGLFHLIVKNTEFVRLEQLESLSRGIAMHHAGVLPVWKELVEKLFEIGLVKVVFATATLSAGINMPARTTVISALSKRTDDGHSMLTASEFVQIAGRAGRRGKDEVGYVVTIQSPYEGVREASYLATAKVEPLKSCFTPSYGMVLNLLQKHTIEEAKDLLESSFAEYLSGLRLEPQRQSINELNTALAKLNVELAGTAVEEFISYEKLKERIRIEEHIFKLLKQQAQELLAQETISQVGKLALGSIIYLKGKHIPLKEPVAAVLIARRHGSGLGDDLICLGSDNRWYIAPASDVLEIIPSNIPLSLIEQIFLPDLESLNLGPGPRSDESTIFVIEKLAQLNLNRAPMPPEVIQQRESLLSVQAQLEKHPLSTRKNPGRLLKIHHQRLLLREQLHQEQINFKKHQSRKSYYWEEFLNLIEILRQFKALDGYLPTSLGEAAAAIRGENELWVGLALASGAFDNLEAPHLAAALSALITEPLRPETWTNYQCSLEVLDCFKTPLPNHPDLTLREIRRKLYQAQSHHDITIPVWLETQLLGLVEQWAMGLEWQQLLENTSLDEGDLVRLFRRTIDVLWQIPQIPHIPSSLIGKAREAIALLKRFPI